MVGADFAISGLTRLRNSHRQPRIASSFGSLSQSIAKFDISGEYSPLVTKGVTPVDDVGLNTQVRN
jgi:hypothetical protein